MSEVYQDIPCWDNGTWKTVSYDSKEAFSDDIKSIFSEPGKYNFDETSFLFNQEAVKFRDQNIYCAFPFRSRDFISYWDDQKHKCRKGIIVKDGDLTWFVCREYYMWLNFLPIFDKEIQLDT